MAGKDPPPPPPRPPPRSVAAHWHDFSRGIADDIAGFAWDTPRTRRALATGLTTATAILVALALDLDYPMWSGITAFLIIQASVRATALKAVLRVISTLAAALVAVAIIGFLGDIPILLTVALFITVSYPLYRSYRSPFPYAWQLGAITVGIILIAAMADPDIGLTFAAYRAAEIVVGTAVGWVVAMLLLPESLGPDVDRALAKAQGTPPALAAWTAIEAGIGVVLVTLVYAFLALPGFSSAAVSMTRLVDPDPELGRHRGLLRVIGCAVGGGVGVACVALGSESVLSLALIVFVATAVFGYFFTGGAASSYAGMQAGMAFIIAFAPTAAPTTTLAPAIDRLAGIAIAVAVFWLVDGLLGREPAAADPPPDAGAPGGAGKVAPAAAAAASVADAGGEDPVVDHPHHVAVDQP